MMEVAAPVIERFHADVEALFTPEVMGTFCPGVPVPRVTFGQPASGPEPLHVFTWGLARDFDVAGVLSGRVVGVTFRIWLTVVATASTAEDAADVANAYQALALQVPLCDPQLGGTVAEIGAPQVREAEEWADADGRRHAGYLLEYEAMVHVGADRACEAAIAGME